MIKNIHTAAAVEGVIQRGAIRHFLRYERESPIITNFAPIDLGNLRNIHIRIGIGNEATMYVSLFDLFRLGK